MDEVTLVCPSLLFFIFVICLDVLCSHSFSCFQANAQINGMVTIAKSMKDKSNEAKTVKIELNQT